MLPCHFMCFKKTTPVFEGLCVQMSYFDPFVLASMSSLHHALTVVGVDGVFDCIAEQGGNLYAIRFNMVAHSSRVVFHAVGDTDRNRASVWARLRMDLNTKFYF